jgi:hypothetical protein
MLSKSRSSSTKRNSPGSEISAFVSCHRREHIIDHAISRLGLRSNNQFAPSASRNSTNRVRQVAIPSIEGLRAVCGCHNERMPPSPSPTRPETSIDTGHMLARPNPPAGGEGGLPEHAQSKKAGMGAWIGILIIVVLFGFGALYFWGASLNREQEELPFIPGDSSELEQ